MTPLLELRSVVTGYAANGPLSPALQTGVHRGEFVCLLGPNGAGKSTLLRTLAGTVPPHAGEVLIDGTGLTALPSRTRARRISVVLTERVGGLGLTGYDLVALGRLPYVDWTGRYRTSDHEAIQRALQDVDASELAEKLVAEMSDGEVQRILIARALAQQGDLLLLDEVTAFLDLPRRFDIMRLLRDLARRDARAIILSSHDLDLALRVADRIWLMPQHGVFADGAPEDLVLSGSIAMAFARDGLVFDTHTGTFNWTDRLRHRVVLRGDGVAAHWTRRALARVGVHADAGDEVATTLMPIVRVVTAAEGVYWEVARQGQCVRMYSIAELVRHIEREHSAAP
jgi:iron complex transport system ATP-binding protein